MNVAKQEVTPAWSWLMVNKRSKRLGLALLVAMVIYLGAYAGLLGRWVPIGWFREIPEVTRLHPIVAANTDKLKAQSKQIGINILITSGFRSSDEQDALYRKGRSEDGPIVTQVKGGQSYHNYGLAIDFALLTPKGKTIWDMEYDGNRNGKSDWMEVVALAKRLGFTWGGDWTSFRDYPHLQMDFGYSIRELQWGWRPPVQQR
jgi:peptidoglycan LD-endopeptidase CwlK